MVRVRGSGVSVRVYPLEMSESIPIRAQQHDCLNRSWIRTMRDMTKRKEKTHKASTLHNELEVMKECWEIAFLRQRHIKLPNTNVSSENIHMNHVTQTEQAVFRNTHTHTCIYAYMHVTISNEKRGLGFERKQGKIYKRFWERKRRESDTIIF